jgi:RHH-type proline utilization regulon transcriptional repressor/proline dehydrogenase/delta 1-pyrroline-5-carboxylate dehydrogenase
MGEGVYRELQRTHDVPLRVYAPVGEHRDLLAYLVRRLLENGANSSFVHQLADPAVGLDSCSRRRCAAPEPALPLPRDAVRRGRPQLARRRPAVPAERAPLRAAVARPRRPRARGRRGRVDAPMQRLRRLRGWTRRRLATRAASCAAPPTRWRRAAELLRPAGEGGAQDARRLRGRGARGGRLLPLLRRAGREQLVPRTLPGPTGESNDLQLHGRGVFVCISPWNFPLAIFAGQVVAALAAGNAVAAKPAEQTPGGGRALRRAAA